MCRRALIGLEPTAQAAGEARRFVVSTYERWGIDSAKNEISLAVSELVTNAVLHAKTHVEVAICVRTEPMPGTGAAHAEVAVRDNDRRLPVLRPARRNVLADIESILGRQLGDVGDDDSEAALRAGPSGSIAAGRGLLILDALADEWGITKRADGKEVWFAVAVDWKPPHACPCDESTSRTASGRSCSHVKGPWDTAG